MEYESFEGSPMNKIYFTITTLVFFTSCFISFAYAEDTVSGEMMANTCSACHSTNTKIKDDFIPQLLGMSQQQFIQSMNAYKNGSRDATIMDRVARAFSDKEIKAMAIFFASKKQGVTNATN